MQVRQGEDAICEKRKLPQAQMRISFLRLLLFAATLICYFAFDSTALAQHGEAEAGLYTFDYHGDTWTGTLSAVDHEKDAITLIYEHKDKTENFTGILKRPLEVVDENGQPTKAQTHLNIGDRITVYYIAQGRNYSMREDDGKRHKRVAADNLVFKIKLLPPAKHKP